VTVRGNAVNHITYFPGSYEFWETFTFTLRFTGSDGSVVSGHETGHMTWLGDPDTTAPTASFDKMNFTCG